MGQAKFLGQKVFDSRNQDVVSMSWLIDQNNYDSFGKLPGSFVVPNTNITTPAAVNWYSAALIPVSYQGNRVFGDVLSVQLQISQSPFMVDAAGTTAVVPGRVILHSPSSGQFVMYGPTLNASGFISTGLRPTDNRNEFLNLHATVGSSIQVFLEQDQFVFVGGAPAFPATEVVVTLFNSTIFTVQPVPA